MIEMVFLCQINSTTTPVKVSGDDIEAMMELVCDSWVSINELAMALGTIRDGVRLVKDGVR